MHRRGKCKLHRFDHMMSNMAVCWCASFLCACVTETSREGRVLLRMMRCDETQFEWVHTRSRKREVECVKVDERASGKMDINGYELAWPAFFLLSFFCSWSKLGPRTQQLGCFSGHSKGCAKRVAGPKSINLMEWKTPQHTNRSTPVVVHQVITARLMSSTVELI